jgi:dihydromonapterin reductase/dihydrofolate reductase
VISEAILITGVGRRLGLHLARSFMERGIPVIGTYRTEHDTLRDLRAAGAVLHYCDFYDAPLLNALVTAVQNDCGSLRAIIHNASDWLPDDAGLPPEEIIQRMMRVHVYAPYRLNLALAPLLEASGRQFADIIHVGDYVSTKGSTRHIAYAASKAAQDNLTKSFAARLAPKIKVNSIAPALMLFNEGDDEAYRKRALDKSLIPHEGGVDEFQQAVDYLLESRYMTGRVLHLDGGRHLR